MALSPKFKRKSEILQIFDETFPDQLGCIGHDEFIDVLTSLMPEATEDEINCLLDASGAQLDDEPIHYKLFFDYVYGREWYEKERPTQRRASIEKLKRAGSLGGGSRGSKRSSLSPYATEGVDKLGDHARSPSRQGSRLPTKNSSIAQTLNEMSFSRQASHHSLRKPTKSDFTLAESEAREWYEREIPQQGRGATKQSCGAPNTQDAAHLELETASATCEDGVLACTCGALQGKNLALLVAEAARELLPERVILVRHGESEGNVDPSIYRTKGDNSLELTENGSAQALEAGKRIKAIVGDEAVHMFVSPFQRTLQTARNIRNSIEDQVVQVEKDPRLREQEFGNLQGEDFKKYREEQKLVGRYFYRFPTGESGADVYVRVKDWWDKSLLQLNLRAKYEHVNTVVVVTHGLTMRLILMQLYMWSPNTFHTVWNCGNCQIYVLKRDLELPGPSPYILCPREGDMPRSTISLLVEFKDGKQEMVRLEDYLSIPMPRTHQPLVVKRMLQEQHGIDPEQIEKIDFYAGQFKKYR